MLIIDPSVDHCATVSFPVNSRFPCQLRRLHRPGGASRQDHGTGPAGRRPPHARLHDGEEENLGHVHLLRVDAVQGSGTASGALGGLKMMWVEVKLSSGQL